MTRAGFWPTTPTRAWWHVALAVPALAVLLWVPFVRGTRVPVLGWLDLAVHEFGHVATLWLPTAANLAMGSVAQVALPLGLAAGLWWRSRDPLGAGLALAWAGSSAQDASIYIADAPFQRLPLIGGLHDWGTLLGPAHLDALDAAAPLARTVWLGGLLLGLGGAAVLARSGWSLWTDRHPGPGGPSGWSMDAGAVAPGAPTLRPDPAGPIVRAR